MWSARDRRQTLGALLNAMAFDRYPAVRQIAWRSLRRLIAASVRRIWGELRGASAVADATVVFQERSAAAPLVLGDVEIGG